MGLSQLLPIMAAPPATPILEGGAREHVLLEWTALAFPGLGRQPRPAQGEWDGTSYHAPPLCPRRLMYSAVALATRTFEVAEPALCSRSRLALMLPINFCSFCSLALLLGTRSVLPRRARRCLLSWRLLRSFHA